MEIWVHVIASLRRWAIIETIPTFETVLHLKETLGFRNHEWRVYFLMYYYVPELKFSFFICDYNFFSYFHPSHDMLFIGTLLTINSFVSLASAMLYLYNLLPNKRWRMIQNTSPPNPSSIMLSDWHIEICNDFNVPYILYFLEKLNERIMTSSFCL